MHQSIHNRKTTPVFNAREYAATSMNYMTTETGLSKDEMWFIFLFEFPFLKILIKFFKHDLSGIELAK